MRRKTQLLDIATRPKLRLAEVERLIRRHRIIVPPLTRRTLANMCEQGVFETAGAGPNGKFGWLVYEDSFLRWAKSLEGEAEEAA
ncbi:MAG: hypothetical protein ABI999_07260 [Acidobacteriota bacterium]